LTTDSERRDANRRDANKRRHILRRWASGWHWTRRCKIDAERSVACHREAHVTTSSNEAIFNAGKPRDDNGHDAGKPTSCVATSSVATSSVATKPKDGIFTTGDAIGQKVRKQTPRVATPIVATTPLDTIFGADEPREDNGYEIWKPTPSVATSFEADTRRNIWHRWISGCHWTRRWKTDAKRSDAYHSDASKRRHI
jgi:hypothetical protein